MRPLDIADMAEARCKEMGCFPNRFFELVDSRVAGFKQRGKHSRVRRLVAVLPKQA